MAGVDYCLGLPSRDRRVAGRARLIHGLVEGRVGVDSRMLLMRCLEEGLVGIGILGRVGMVSCLTR